MPVGAMEAKSMKSLVMAWPARSVLVRGASRLLNFTSGMETGKRSMLEETGALRFKDFGSDLDNSCEDGCGMGARDCTKYL